MGNALMPEPDKHREILLKCAKPNLPSNLDNSKGKPGFASLFSNSVKEQEFSGTILLSNPTLNIGDCLENVREMTRYYYEKDCTVYYGSKKLSTASFDNCSEFKTKVIVRKDYRSDESLAAESLLGVSVKLRLSRIKYNWQDTTIKFTQSIDVNIDNNPYEQLRQVEPSKIRNTCCWYVKLGCWDVQYLFSVVFRHMDHDHELIRCNIECKDEIDSDLFGNMFHTLYVYYRFQYETRDGEIEPLVDHMLFQQSPQYQWLNKLQQDIIDTIELAPLPAVKKSEGVPHFVAMFVKHLGSSAMNNFLGEKEDPQFSNCTVPCSQSA